MRGKEDQSCTLASSWNKLIKFSSSVSGDRAVMSAIVVALLCYEAIGACRLNLVDAPAAVAPADSLEFRCLDFQ